MSVTEHLFISYGTGAETPAIPRAKSVAMVACTSGVACGDDGERHLIRDTGGGRIHYEIQLVGSRRAWH